MIRIETTELREALKRFRGSWRSYAPVALVALIGLTVSTLLYTKGSDLERQRAQNAFISAARDRILVMQREMENALSVVQDIGSFFDASTRVSRRQFREFVAPALKRDPSIRTLQWVAWVPAAEREAFLAEARRGFYRFRITEPGEGSEPVDAAGRPESFPVLYVQPYRNNEDLLGLDLGANPSELAALKQAAASAQVQVFARESLLLGSSPQAGIAIYAPIFSRLSNESEVDPGESSEATADPSAKQLRGFAIGRFRFADLVARALSNLSPAGIDITFRPAASDPAQPPLFTHVSRIHAGAATVPEGAVRGAETWTYAGDLRLANLTWTLVCTAIPGRFDPDPWTGRIVLVSGIAFTALLVVYLSTLIGQAEQVKRLVSLRTRELELTNAALSKEIGERARAEGALLTLNVTLEQRVARRSAEAERRARELEQFAYVASHDLKAPLRAIANLAHWLQSDLEDRLTDDTREQLDLLQDRVTRMDALIEGLLSYSRIGRTESANEPVDVGVLLAETIDSLSPPEGFAIRVAPGMPTLRTDRLHLGQVFANLISNSLRHHHRTSGQVQVAARDLGDAWEFSVSDDGPGIAPEYQHKVFQMFQTLEAKDRAGQTGIGLALVKKIVEEHGGSIRLDSEPGKGATFCFTWVEGK